MIHLMMSISLILSVILLFLNHPLSMGLILFSQTIMMCLISGSMSLNFWFSYILLLMYLGGMLILFMYVTSLASNEMFFYSNKIFSLMTMLPIMFIIIFFMKIDMMINLYENMENSTSIYININNFFMLKMYNQPVNIITIMMAIYLFMTLIAVVKIIYIYKGPLRKMM
uniref:NADH-ubiquinone oxidoreductase chain 6 n=1 Tax=Arria pallida TaxID=2754859 RepID=A0A7G6KSP1_9NEOP|nr:NADH dehydrogenase subunit 6 [Arria pallida]QNC71423.1 NADH dehydrogenase subunit 6 [Arria pallida]